MQVLPYLSSHGVRASWFSHFCGHIAIRVLLILKMGAGREDKDGISESLLLPDFLVMANKHDSSSAMDRFVRER